MWNQVKDDLISGYEFVTTIENPITGALSHPNKGRQTLFSLLNTHEKLKDSNITETFNVTSLIYADIKHQHSIILVGYDITTRVKPTPFTAFSEVQLSQPIGDIPVDFKYLLSGNNMSTPLAHLENINITKGCGNSSREWNEITLIFITC